MSHAVELKRIVDRIAERRGGVRSIYPSIDPKRTAHLIVDMQNGFMEEGAPVEVPAARGIVHNINRISRAVRAAGGTNIFLRYTTANGDTAWPIFLERMGTGADAHREAFTPGAHYWQLWPTLDVADSDIMIEKHRFSGFTQGTCDLHRSLQARGIDTLIVTGTLTNCCCESTVRDAMQLNYKVLMVADAKPGTRLVRSWHGVTHSVLVIEDGFVFEDKHYGSLTAIAEAITGTRWSGPRFFGLKEKRGG